jgi:adenosine deaminase
LRLFRTETFEQFVATYVFVGCYTRSASDFRKLVLGVLKGLKSQNVIYAEITVSIHRHVRNGISLADIGACLDEGANYGESSCSASDDLTFFGTTLADEYAQLRNLGFGDRNIYEVLENGFRYAFLPPEEIESYLDGLRRAWNELSPSTPSGR